MTALYGKCTIFQQMFLKDVDPALQQMVLGNWIP